MSIPALVTRRFALRIWGMRENDLKKVMSLAGFAEWLRAAGASSVTVENYCRAVGAWVLVLSQSELEPRAAWGEWGVGKSSKRMAGFACRRYAEYHKETTGKVVELGIPSRLPAASSPRPRPVSDDDFAKLLHAAKRVLPKGTGYSMRIWLRFVEALGLRRSESEIAWDSINWVENSVVVNGKTGERELPLTRKMLKLLGWLRSRNGEYPWLGARGQELKGRTLYNIFKTICVAAGAPKLHPHLLRHRRLTALCRSSLGSNSLLVLAFSGHAHLASLQHYYSVSVDEKRALLANC